MSGGDRTLPSAASAAERRRAVSRASSRRHRELQRAGLKKLPGPILSAEVYDDFLEELVRQGFAEPASIAEKNNGELATLLGDLLLDAVGL